MFGNMFEAYRDSHSEQEEIDLKSEIIDELIPQIGGIYAIEYKDDLMLVYGEREDGSFGYATVIFDPDNVSDQVIEKIGGEELVTEFEES